METFQELLKQTFWSNTVQSYLIAFGIFIALIIIFKIFEKIILIQIEKWAKKTTTDIDDEAVKILESIPDAFYMLISVYIALQFLVVNITVSKILNALLIILIIFWGTKAVSNLIEFALYKMSSKKGEKRTEKNSTYFALSLVAKIILWTTGILLLLSNLGVNITALVASLGIGGIAIALALQNILGDIFSSFSIYFDKPFEIGDYIVIGDQKGTVKRIGLKTTRVQSLQGEEIVISNRELTSAQIRNFKKMKKRRITFEIHATYDTPSAKSKKIIKIIKYIFKKVKLCTLDRVHFKEFGSSALIFEIVYFIDSAEYGDYMDKQQEMNFAIKKEFEKEGIEMAFPTQTLHVNRLN